MKTKGQSARLLEWLRQKPIQPLQAWAELGIYRLGARIYDLRASGHRIGRQMVTVRNRFGEPCRVAQYTLEKEADAETGAGNHQGNAASVEHSI